MPTSAGIGEERHARSIDEGVATRTREHQRAIRELRGERCGHVSEPLEIVGVEMDDEAIGDERSIGGRETLRLHRALDGGGSHHNER